MDVMHAIEYSLSTHTAHKTYIGFIYLEYIQNNSVMNVFVSLLQQSVQCQRQQRQRGLVEEIHFTTSDCK